MAKAAEITEVENMESIWKRGPRVGHIFPRALVVATECCFVQRSMDQETSREDADEGDGEGITVVTAQGDQLDLECLPTTVPCNVGDIRSN